MLQVILNYAEFEKRKNNPQHFIMQIAVEKLDS